MLTNPTNNNTDTYHGRSTPKGWRCLVCECPLPQKNDHEGWDAPFVHFSSREALCDHLRQEHQIPNPVILDTRAPQTAQEPPDPTRYFDEKKFIPKLLAEELLAQYQLITMMDNEQLYVYLDGCYRLLGEVIIKQECQTRLDEEYRKNRALEVIDYVKASTYTERREEPAQFIPLQNGILDLTTMVLQPASPALMFFNKIPVNYDPAATCPHIDTFLQEITLTSEDVEILEECVGFCLYRDYPFAKALMLVGDGANGKSTFLNLIKTFLGVANVSGRSLQDLEEHRFAKADLYTKLANIYADLPDRALYRTGTFKILTGRDLITAEKKFQHSFQFMNYAKLLFSANKVPEAQDDTTAFFRRWIIVTFPFEFKGENADPYILEKLTTDDELSGFLNKALAGLTRLLEKGVFSHSKTTQETREEYIRKSSPVNAFIMDCLEVDADAFIIKKELFAEFAEYCRGRSLPIVTSDTFFKNLPKHAVVSDFRPRIEGARMHSVKGLRWRSDGWSNRSSQSRVFYILISKKDDYPHPYEPIPLKDKTYIKIGITLDRVDRLDRVADQQQRVHQILKYIHDLSQETIDRSTPPGKVIERAALDGIPREAVQATLEHLLDKGKIIQPTPSAIRLVDPVPPYAFGKHCEELTIPKKPKEETDE